MASHSYSKLLLIVLTGSLFVLAGCGRRGLPGYYPLDSPEHHFQTGMKLIERYNLGDVEREFLRARELDKSFAPAYVGLALVFSAKGDFDKALKTLELARENIRTDKELTIIDMGTIKVYTDIYLVDKEKGTSLAWLGVAEKAYTEGLKYDSENAALHYYMGRAYKVGGKYDKAVESFKQVVELNAGYTLRAQEELARLARTIAQDKE